MNSGPGLTDRTVNAISLIEEICLAALLDDLAHGRSAGGLSPEEIAVGVGLARWLGPAMASALVERILLNLSAAGKTRRSSTTDGAQRWTITADEASIRRPPPAGRARG